MTARAGTNSRDARDRAVRKLIRKILLALSAGRVITRQPARAGTKGDVSPIDFVIAAQAGRRGGAIMFDSKIMGLLLTMELIAASGAEAWRISDVGVAWLKRTLSQGDGFLEQHADLRRQTVEDAGQAVVTVNAAESPLAWLKGRKGKDGAAFLSDAQLAAGERLRRDFTYAGLSPRMSVSWDVASGRAGQRSGRRQGHAELLDSVLDARQRFNRAVAVVGPELSDVLIDVCCFLRGLEDVETARGWPRRSGKVILKLALERLARHYGLQPAAGIGARVGGIRHWGAEGYRPELEA